MCEPGPTLNRWSGLPLIGPRRAEVDPCAVNRRSVRAAAGFEMGADVRLV
jgi:hypothetical protein